MSLSASDLQQSPWQRHFQDVFAFHHQLLSFLAPARLQPGASWRPAEFTSQPGGLVTFTNYFLLFSNQYLFHLHTSFFKQTFKCSTFLFNYFIFFSVPYTCSCSSLTFQSPLTFNRKNTVWGPPAPPASVIKSHQRGLMRPPLLEQDAGLSLRKEKKMKTMCVFMYAPSLGAVCHMLAVCNKDSMNLPSRHVWKEENMFSQRPRQTEHVTG